MNLNDWLLILLSILAVIVIFFIIGLISFLLSLLLEKKILTLADEVDKLNEKRNDILNRVLSKVKEDKRVKRVDFEQFELNNEDTLSTMRNKQDVAFILLKKVISSSKCREEYKDDIKEIDDLIKESENIFENYNKKTSSYNAFIRFIFARPYAYFAKKKTYPLIY